MPIRAVLIAGLVAAPIAAASPSASAAEPVSIKINEVESSGGTPGDWIELTNTGATATDLSGLVLKDNDDTHAFTIPAGTAPLEPGGFYIADVDAAFGLGGGDSARLFAADGATLLDSYTWTAHAATTYGRCPDGTGEFRATTSSTRGSANDCSVPPPTTIRINEVESSGGTPGDWIELTNVGATSVDISGLVLKDNDDSHAFTVPAATTLAAGAFVAFDVESAFGLGGADAARLFAADGTTLLDSYTWTAHAGTTYGRCPDGAGGFAETVAASKGAANDCASVELPAVVINEVESSGGTPGDWVELLNTGSAAADVSGWQVKDNDPSHTFALPAGTTIPAGGYYIADVDPVFGLGAADTAQLLLPDGATVVDAFSWTAHAATTYGRCPDGTGPFVTTATPTRGAANDCAGAPLPALTINEVESSGGTPGDWIELRNTGGTAIDASGFLLKDNDDSHVLAIPAGTTIAAGAYWVADVEAAFGLGSADSARLYLADGTTLLDSYTWTAHAATTYGRCPDGTGEFATTTEPTKGSVNACAGDVVALTWPGGPDTAAVDVEGYFGTNLSGLAYEAATDSSPAVLWAVKNGPGTLYRLLWNGVTWAPDAANGWADGKVLHYADGTGDPDAEGITLVNGSSAGGVYVSTERNNAASSVSRPAILHFAVSGSGTTINADVDWNLTADLPPLGANLGLEAIAWLPDGYLTDRGFLDERTGAPYDPADYPAHGQGLFATGVEANGTIYAYALRPDGGYTRVAAFASGFVGVMDLEFDPEIQQLWAWCDNTCGNRSATLDIVATFIAAQPEGSAQAQAAGDGRFAVTAVYAPPAGLPDVNNEGFAIAPQSACIDGLKPAFWSDDDNTGGHALRAGTIACTALPVEPEPTDPPTGQPADPTPAPTPAAPSPAGGSSAPAPKALASTGADGASHLRIALVLLAAGAAALGLGRRRPAVG